MGSLVAGSCGCVNDYGTPSCGRKEDISGEAGCLVLQDDFPCMIERIIDELRIGREKQKVRYVLVLSEALAVPIT